MLWLRMSPLSYHKYEKKYGLVQTSTARRRLCVTRSVEPFSPEATSLLTLGVTRSVIPLSPEATSLLILEDK